MRVTRQDLKNLCEAINKQAGIKGRSYNTPNMFHVSSAYGGVKLEHPQGRHR